MYAPAGAQVNWPLRVCADADAATATREKSVEKSMLTGGVFGWCGLESLVRAEELERAA